jgi:hypothetical protein
MAGRTWSCPQPHMERVFWIFVGTYKNQWLSKYINFPDVDPTKTEFSPGFYKVSSGSLNVRLDRFGLSGEFPPPTTHLERATEFT